MAKVSASTLTGGIGSGAAQVFKFKEIDFSYRQKKALAEQKAKQSAKKDDWSMPTGPWYRDQGSLLGLGNIYEDAVRRGKNPGVLANMERQIDSFVDISNQIGKEYNKIKPDQANNFTEDSWAIWDAFSNQTNKDLLTYDGDTGDIYYDGVPFYKHDIFSLPSLEKKVTYDFQDLLQDRINIDKAIKTIEDGDKTTVEAEATKIRGQISTYINSNPLQLQMKDYFVDLYIRETLNVDEYNEEIKKYYLGQEVSDETMGTINNLIEDEANTLEAESYDDIKNWNIEYWTQDALNRIGYKEIYDEPKKDGGGLFINMGGGATIEPTKLSIEQQEFLPFSYFLEPKKGDKWKIPDVTEFSEGKSHDLTYNIIDGYNLPLKNIPLSVKSSKMLSGEYNIKEGKATVSTDVSLKTVPADVTFDNSTVFGVRVLPTLTEDVTVTVEDNRYTYGGLRENATKITFKAGDVVPNEFVGQIENYDKKTEDKKWWLIKQNNIEHLVPYEELVNQIKGYLKTKKLDLQGWEKDIWGWDTDKKGNLELDPE